MSKTLENLKSGNYEVVDNKGVSVTQHFIECLEKEFADLEVKELKQQLVINEKALELACEHIKEDLKCDDTQDEIYNYFKSQAKEMLKNE